MAYLFKMMILPSPRFSNMTALVPSLNFQISIRISISSNCPFISINSALIQLIICIITQKCPWKSQHSFIIFSIIKCFSKINIAVYGMRCYIDNESLVFLYRFLIITNIIYINTVFQFTCLFCLMKVILWVSLEKMQKYQIYIL